MKKFGKFLKEVRQRLRLSQKDFALKASLCPLVYKEIESCMRRVSFEEMDKLTPLTCLKGACSSVIFNKWGQHENEWREFLFKKKVKSKRKKVSGKGKRGTCGKRQNKHEG